MRADEHPVTHDPADRDNADDFDRACEAFARALDRLLLASAPIGQAAAAISDSDLA